MKTIGVRLALFATVFFLLLGVPQDVNAQARTVTGTVTDAQTGAAIAGAQITIRDRGIGTLSNEDGRYLLLNVPEGRVEVRVLFLGYSPQSREVEISSGGTVVENFQLTIQAIQMEELVATGYAEQTRREVTSAIAMVSSVELESPTVASLDGLLQGKTAGLHIVPSAGNPGNAMAVRIRGSSSLTADNTPLYVVDGMPIFRDDFSQGWSGGQNVSGITGLAPEDIESISVLKDAAAAAIYGSRGSNGVVLITTKRGTITTGDAPRFEFNVSTGQQRMADKIDYMGTEDYLAYFADGMRMDGYTEGEIQDEFDSWGVDPNIDTDWLDVISRTAPITNASLSMSGGSSRFRYRLSGSWFDQLGIIKGSGYNRAAGSANMDFKATDRLDLSVSVTLSQEVNDRIQSDDSWVAPTTDAMAQQPWVPVYMPDGSYSEHGAYPNPLAGALEDQWDLRTLRGFGNLEARAEIMPWLRATARLGFDYMDMREYKYGSPLVPLTSAMSNGGWSAIGNAQGRRTLVEGFLTANRFFGVNEITVVAGGSTEGTDRERSYVEGNTFTSEQLKWIENAAIAADYSGTTWGHSLKSGFARANYTYDNRYILNGSLRADGSSRFGPDNKWGTFKALSAAWQMTNEDFMEGVDYLTDLKLRASIGETGNEAIGNFRFLGLYGTANYGDTPGWAPSNLANPALSWEKTTEWDVGVDASFFSDRLGLVVDIYKKETDDLLLSRPVAATTGFTFVLDNVGSMENKGFEVLLRSVNVRSGGEGGLEWTSEFSLTHNMNKVTKLYSADPNEPGEPFRSGRYSRIAEGRELSEFWGYHYEGVDPANGNALFSDLDENGVRIGTTASPGSDDRMFIGSPHPDYFGGLRNTVDFRGFDFSAFFQYSFGNEMFNGQREWGDDGALYQDNKFTFVDDDYWTPENTDAANPRPSVGGYSGAWIQSDRWVEDASYVRLQELTLGYTLPSSLASNLRMQRIRLYMVGRNLYTWTDYNGFSPDMNWGGGSTAEGDWYPHMLGTDFYGYPLARTFTIGFQGTW
jgi:TonB-linked SusC/RagA family outer membrane protein